MPAFWMPAVPMAKKEHMALEDFIRGFIINTQEHLWYDKVLTKDADIW